MQLVLTMIMMRTKLVLCPCNCIQIVTTLFFLSFLRSNVDVVGFQLIGHPHQTKAPFRTVMWTSGLSQQLMYCWMYIRIKVISFIHKLYTAQAVLTV